MLFSYTEVAYFDLALKIVNICNTFLDLISQTIFPKMSLEKNAKFLRKVIKLSLIISVVAIVFLQIFSDKIIIILGGLSMLPAIEVLRVLAFFIPIYILGALLGRNCLIVYGFDRYVLISMLLSGSLYSLTLLFINAFNYNISILWLCFLFLFSFAVETFYRYYICRIKNLL
jgi:PST family polysaccharide transporter